MKFPSKKILLFSIFLMIIGTLKWFHIYDCCNVKYIHDNLHTLQIMVYEHYYFSVISYMALYIIASACAIPGSSFFLIAGGVFFGLIPGLLFANISATIGATILFLLSRYFFGSWVHNKYPVQSQKFNKEIARQGHAYLLLVRLIAIFPFFLVNLLSGLTILPLHTFMWTTSLGMVPMAFAYILVGHQLAKSNSLDMLFSMPLLLAFGLFGLLRVIIVPYVYYFVKKRKKSIHVF